MVDDAVGPQTVDTIHVLIIEDNQHLQECYKRYLQRFGDMDATWIVSTAEEAIVLLERTTPGLIVTDLSLPDAEGTDVVKWIRDVAADVPLLVVSGHHETSWIQSALQCGANGYVLKGEARAIVNAARAVLNGDTYLSESIRGVHPSEKF